MNAAGHFNKAKPDCEDKYYIKVKLFYGNSLEVIKSTLARVRNQYCKGINEQTLLPKAVVILLDDSLISDVKFTGFGVSDIYGHLMHWLAAELNKITEIQKD